MSDPDRTIWCGNLSSEATEEILYELFLQAGPLENVSRPRDARSGESRSYAFVTFCDEQSVHYAVQLFEDTQLFGRQLRLQPKAPDFDEKHRNVDDWLGWGHRFHERPPCAQSHHTAAPAPPSLYPAVADYGSTASAPGALSSLNLLNGVYGGYMNPFGAGLLTAPPPPYHHTAPHYGETEAVRNRASHREPPYARHSATHHHPHHNHHHHHHSRQNTYHHPHTHVQPHYRSSYGR